MRIVPIILALGVAAIIAVAAVLLTSGSSGYEIKANLADADGLLTGSRVEIGGVAVGSVKKLQVTSKDHALVTFTVNKADAPVGQNASLVIRPADLLGEKFVDLNVGNRSKPVRSGFTIPTQRTQEATDFDQVVDVLGPTERDRLAILLHETGVALFGRGADVQKLLTALPPSLSDATSLISQINSSNTQLEQLINRADGVVGTLDQHQAALQHFVATGAGALSATAAHTVGLKQTIAEAPALLSQLQTTLRSLDQAGAKLRPAAAGLRRTAPALTETLKELPGFTQAAAPTLAEVKRISPQLSQLGTEAAPVIARLRPTMQKLQTFATDAQPVTAGLNSSIVNLLGTLQGWARAIQTQDGASHEFRVSIEATSGLVNELAGLITNTGTSTPARKGTQRSPQSPGSASQVPSLSGAAGASAANLGSTLSSTLDNTGSALGGTVNKVVGGVTGAVNGVTSQLGATQTSPTTTTTGASDTSTGSLNSLLGYLLGGSK